MTAAKRELLPLHAVPPVAASYGAREIVLEHGFAEGAAVMVRGGNKRWAGAGDPRPRQGLSGADARLAPRSRCHRATSRCLPAPGADLPPSSFPGSGCVSRDRAPWAQERPCLPSKPKPRDGVDLRTMTSPIRLHGDRGHKTRSSP